MELHKPFATVTPTLDGDVLMVLARVDDETFTISQINRILPKVSGEGLRKVLNRLTAQGVVIHVQVGRTSTYRFNTEHLAAGPIRALARMVDGFLDRLEEHFRTWEEEPVYAAVFGSAMTGQMGLDSDIDLFLVRATAPEPVESKTFSDTLWEEQVAELARTVTAWTGNDARVVEYTENDLRTAAAGEPLLSEIARRGRTVAGTKPWLLRLLRDSGHQNQGRA